MARFKVGDWVIEEYLFRYPSNYIPFISKILEVSNDMYICQFLDGRIENVDIEYIDRETSNENYVFSTRLLTDEEKIELL